MRGMWDRWGGSRPSLRQLGTFLYVWLTVGFASGTLVLLAPVRWLTDLSEAQGWAQRSEDIVMWAVIAAYVVASLVAAVALTRLLFQYRARAFKYGVVLGLTGVAAIALWGWSHPSMYVSLAGGGADEEAVETRSGAIFTFGPYPTRERLEELKDAGYTAVVSLQHPAVVPMEPQGIAKEKEWAGELGLRFVHAPMLPWVSDNEASLEQIREIARTGSGRYYVHCGLGRDRVNVVKRMLERMGAVSEGSDIEQAMGWEGRIQEGLGDMEHGGLVELEPDAWLVPRPNEHELFGNMLAGQAGLIVVLLDPSVPEQDAAIREMTRLFDDYDIAYRLRPLAPGDAVTAQEIVSEFAPVPGPITFVAPTTPPRPGSQVAELFEEAWRR